MAWEGEVIYGTILIFDSHLNISKAWMKYVQVTIKRDLIMWSVYNFHI